MDERTDLSKGLPLEITGSKSQDVAWKFFYQAMNAAPLNSSNNRGRGDHAVAIVDTIRGLGPCDVIEGMLAVQLTAVQDAIMDCFARAASTENDQERDRNLRTANKLISQFVALQVCLQKKRDRDRHISAEEDERLGDAIGDEIVRRFVDDVRKENAEMREKKAKMREKGEAGEIRREGDPSSHASKPPLRSTNTKRQSLPSAVRSRPKTVPDARLRPGERRPEG